ncbi:type IV pilus biogenesis/stability protein PilW [Exilibacterium tricleocarpae]|uniref:Type IV pilus biogenesis/stability protein PilW n=1 Tax=Exilibacterium tricleocarpae TaxID=2591008 RepID=A0A545U8C8_9GAMM|nr:type IV pilus biogenesis/stability protein PilW [Exilibacterium tricleocarpae]TQV85721.1 type IV pilus biogenesis/stability protein PilW [Exilibacterium tricleocarpae]
MAVAVIGAGVAGDRIRGDSFRGENGGGAGRGWSARVALLLLTGVLALVSGCVTTNAPGSKPKPKIDKEKALQTYIQLGIGYLSKKNRESARYHFNKAFEIDRNAPGAHNGMALLYKLEGEPELAEKHFRRAIRVNPRFSQAHNNYGSFLYSRERYKEAYKHFKLAADDIGYDRRPIALANLGRAALRLDRVERAKAVFEHSLSLDNRLSMALVELADIYFQEQDYAAAKRHLDQFARVAPQTPRTLWLGIRIERIFGNKDKEASYALALRNLHRYSREYLEYQKALKN